MDTADALEIPSERFTFGPRADFLCETCHQAGKMDEPVTLPVLARKCPVCGKARFFRRIWSGANAMPTVIQASRHAKSKFTKSLGIDKQWDAQQAQKRAAVEARSKGRGAAMLSPEQANQRLEAIGAAVRAQTRVQAMPTGSLSQFGLGLKPGSATAMPYAAHPALSAVGGPRPGPDSRNGGGRLMRDQRGRVAGSL